MESLLVFPDPAPPSLVAALDAGGYPWLAAPNADEANRREPSDGWSGGIVYAVEDAEGAFALCRSLRGRDLPFEPVLVVLSANQLDDLELREELFDDFCVSPIQGPELGARLRHLFWRTGRGTRPELIEYGPLVLNLETYQAAVAGKPLDLTYM